MTLYSILASIFSYIFTFIIYLFILLIIRLIYTDIRNMNGKVMYVEEEEVPEEAEWDARAVLVTVRTEESDYFGLKKGYRIGEGPITVGRGEDCDIQVKNKYLSIEHFQIWFEDGVWYLKDLGSRNGTYHNDIKIRKITPLSEGDEITFGGLTFIFQPEYGVME